jgi:hypothetical protein
MPYYLYEKRVLQDINILKNDYFIYTNLEKHIIELMDEYQYYRVKIPHDYPIRPIHLYCINKNTKKKKLCFDLYSSWIQYYYKLIMNKKYINRELYDTNLQLYWSPKNKMHHLVREANNRFELFKSLRSFYYGQKQLSCINNLNNDLLGYILSFIFNV